jgi:hypothetical protein
MSDIVVYAGVIGEVISLVLINDDGTPIDLTSSTVTLNMRSSGNNASVWNHTATIDSATQGLAHYTTVSGDLATVGSYYILVNIAYVGGNVNIIAGPTIQIISNQENLVTYEEFMEFIDIPLENGKKPATVKSYLEEGELQVNYDVPGLANTTDAGYIRLKKTLIKFKAGMLYFMNMDENLIDPNTRLEKADMWRKEYNRLVDHFNTILASTSETSTSIFRRVKNSDYSNPDSYLYEE